MYVSLLLTLLLALSGLVLNVEGSFRRSNKKFLRNKGYGSNRKPTGECGNELLTCVHESDCELECPYGFERIEGACYHFSNTEFNPPRTLNEADDYCENINARLLWLEDSKELRDLFDFHLYILSNTETRAPTSTDLPIDQASLFFIAAEYDKHYGSWIWRNTRDEIDWEIILYGTPNSSESLKAVEDANTNKCLVLNLPAKLPLVGSLIKESECIDSNGYICKMGEANARCTKTKSTACCYSPSYDFYAQDREIGYSNLNLRAGSCQMKTGNELRNCEEVLLSIDENRNENTNMYSVARIGSSYYYIANETDDCLGRDAIIDKDVHEYVTMLFATREIFYTQKNVKVGLTFHLENQMAKWIDGKPEKYYDTFWFPGEPKRDASVDGGCAAYSNLPDSSVFLWRLFSKEMCEDFIKVCELPLFQSTTRLGKEENCGKRRERGVLAKSIHSIYSTEEANFGEFPWQAAIMYPEKYGRELKRKFACSGALVHKNFILTSARCVTSVGVQDLVATLGIHDLKDSEAILEPLVIDVNEVFVHEDYNVRHGSKNDIALLQLDGDVAVELYPHIGIGCLPNPDEIRSHVGEWECYETGWSNERKYGTLTKVMKRIEVDFTSEEFCRDFTKEHDYTYLKGKLQHFDYNKFGAYEREAEFLCTSHLGECLDDSSPILVCKKATSYVKRPFFSSSSEDFLDQDLETPKSDQKQIKDPKYDVEEKEIKVDRSTRSSYTKRQPYSEEEYILNAYGEDRFDSDKWYIIGVGNILSGCSQGYSSRYTNQQRHDQYGHYQRGYGSVYRRKEQRPLFNKAQDGLKTEVFTSVYDHIDFIHYILDLNH